jgi:Family of unknown function (DUF6350)
VTAALWAAGVGLLVVGALVTLSWALTGRGDSGLSTALRASGVVWLAGQHAAVDTVTPSGPGASVTLLPMLVHALMLVLLVLAGRWAVRASSVRSASDVTLLVVATVATYTCVGVVLAQISSLAGATVSGPTATLACGLTAALGVSTGAISGSDAGARLLARLPAVVRRGVMVAIVAGASLVAMAGVVAVVAVVSRWSSVTSLAHQVAPGAGDAVGLFLLSLAYLPNLLVWTLAYVAGPGFGVGATTSVSPFSSGGGLLPAVPLLGAVPSPSPSLAPLLLLLPVLAGLVGSVVLRRRHRGLGQRDEALTLLSGAGLLGVAAAVLCGVSSGSLGDGRLVALGPAPLATALALGGFVAAGALLHSLGSRLMPTFWVTDVDLTD